jgi:hypothetical protein
MPEMMRKPRPAATKKARRTSQQRMFESSSMALQSLRLIAAPRPEDDLSDDELSEIIRRPAFSSELIQNLIECIKSI